MPTPPRRRWFQFSLRAMFVVVTLAAFGAWRVKEWRVREWQRGNQWVVIAQVRGLRHVDIAVNNELIPHGIVSECPGAKARFIKVHRRDSKHAREILLKSESLKRYQLRIEEEDLNWDRPI